MPLTLKSRRRCADLSEIAPHARRAEHMIRGMGLSVLLFSFFAFAAPAAQTPDPTTLHGSPLIQGLDRFSIRRRAEALASADTRTLKRALYGETQTALVLICG